VSQHSKEKPSILITQTVSKYAAYVATAIAVSLSIFHIYTAWFGTLSPLAQRFVHLWGTLMIGFFVACSNGYSGSRWLSLFLGISSGILGFWFLSRLSPQAVLDRGIWGLTPVEQVAGILLGLLVLELTRRTIGLPIVIVALIFIAYALFGPYMPLAIAHKGYDLARLSHTLVWTTEGMLGIPLGVSATFVAIFILFGSFLETLGGSSFFLDLATSIAGHRKGGPAQVAVISSAAMGTISGSAVANVVTTGSFTIPLMKRLGYPPVFAGAVEAVASTGGQLMPPVMGAAAFVMAEMIEAPYWQIVVAAILPAILYYLSVGAMLYLRADRLNLRSLDRSELPSLKATLIRGSYLIIPVAVLVYLLLWLRYSPMKAGIYTVASLWVVSLVNSVIRKKRFPWEAVLSGLERAGRTMVSVAAACGTAGIIIGVVSLTGLGVRFSQLVLDLAHNNLALTLVFTMVACIVLGMGLPTTAAYIITAVLGVPALVKLGVPLLAAHMFILYFACLSFITPPVALAAYAASGIAEANAMSTGFAAWKLGIAGFIVPFMFVHNPPLLLQGSLAQVILAAVTSILGVAALAISVEGWLKRPVGPIGRLVLLASAILLIKPGFVTDLLGIGLLAISVTLQVRRTRLPGTQTRISRT